MVKKNIMVCVDDGLVRAMRESGINISATINALLTLHADDYIAEAYEQQEKLVEVAKAEVKRIENMTCVCCKAPKIHWVSKEKKVCYDCYSIRNEGVAEALK